MTGAAWGEPRALEGGGLAVTCFFCGHRLICGEDETVLSVCPVCRQDGAGAAQIAALRAVLSRRDLVVAPIKADPTYLMLATDLEKGGMQKICAQGREMDGLLRDVRARLPPYAWALVEAGGLWAAWPDEPEQQGPAAHLLALNPQIDREGPRWRVRPIWLPSSSEVTCG